MNGFESSLLESGNLMRKSVNALLENFGKAVAALTAVIAVLVTFTDVAFADVTTNRFCAEMALMLTSTVIIFFSMEDAGEKLGAQSEGYLAAKAAFRKKRDAVDMTMLEDLRAFCCRYTAEELAYRRRSFLFSFGLSEEEGREGLSPRARRLYRRAKRKKPIRLSPADLLSGDRPRFAKSAENPAPLKLPHLILRLLPTAVCMTITVSVMLTAKEGLTAGVILSGLMRLSTLPVIAFRGFSEGYRYTSEALTAWTEAKTSLLDCFEKERASGKSA